MASSTGTTRRQFLGGSVAGLTVLSSARLVRAYEANERLHLAVFGTLYNAAHILSAAHLYDAPIVALCDPDRRRIAEAVTRWEATAARLENADVPDHRAWAGRYRRMAGGNGVRFYSDVRRMFDEMADSIDAVVVSHYDHLHGVACGPALRAGKPVLSERPLGLNISDARKLRELAKNAALPTTYRSPGTAAGPFRRAMELVENGVIGSVREVHFWFDRGGPDRNALPDGPHDPPQQLNWDAWLGPLPDREFHPDWMAYAHWRETSNGGLGTFGPHTAIFPFIALQLRRLWDQPAGQTAIRVTAECARLNRISFPKWERVRWEVPPRGEMPPVTLTWHHGPEFGPAARQTIRRKLSEVGVESDEEANNLLKHAGSMLVGSDGTLVADDHSVHVSLLPKDKFEDIDAARPQKIPAGRGIYQDWIDACRGRPSHRIASFDNGGPLSELLMLGNIATLFPEETLSYDPAEGRITNKAEANRFLHLDYRTGWTL